jgi:hypothetical protein
MNTIILVGLVNLPMFSHDEFLSGESAVVNDPRRLTTLMTSTAAEGQHFYRPYDSTEDCSFPESGTPLRWSDDFSIAHESSNSVRVSGTFPTWSFNITLELIDRVVWFVKAPVYDHFSVPVRVRGTIANQSVDTYGAIEYARAKIAPGILGGVEGDLFTYHVVQLHADTQLLLGQIETKGKTYVRYAHIRSLRESPSAIESYGPKEVSLDIPVFDRDLRVDSHGRNMRTPREFRFRIAAKGGRKVLDLRCVINTPLREGLGRGYAGGYECTGSFKGKPISGSGLFEWIYLNNTPTAARL